MNWQMLTTAQQAAPGIYAKAMATFIMWMASRIEELRQEFLATRLNLRKGIEAEHKRTADVVAQLAAAWDIFLLFAIEIGATDEAHASMVQTQVWAGLTEVAAEQKTLQQASEPVTRFRDLILGALNTGRAHVARADMGGCPKTPRNGDGSGPTPNGRRAATASVGWTTARSSISNPMSATRWRARSAASGSVPRPYPPAWPTRA